MRWELYFAVLITAYNFLSVIRHLRKDESFYAAAYLVSGLAGVAWVRSLIGGAA